MFTRWGSIFTVLVYVNYLKVKYKMSPLIVSEVATGQRIIENFLYKNQKYFPAPVRKGLNYIVTGFIKLLAF